MDQNELKAKFDNLFAKLHAKHASDIQTLTDSQHATMQRELSALYTELVAKLPAPAQVVEPVQPE